MPPLISIIIPVYNVEKHILQCLESVCSQSYKNIEIILIDDYSTDNSSSLITDFFKDKNKENFKFFTQKTNQGPALARNLGIDNASGEYIYFLDSDDTITANCIEKLATLAQKYDADITIGNFICIDHKTKEEKTLFTHNVSFEYIGSNEDIIKAFLIDKSWYALTTNKLYLRKFFIKNNLSFNTKLKVGEDELLAYYSFNHANKIAITNDITYIYYFNDKSITFNKSVEDFRNLRLIAEDIYNYTSTLKGLSKNYNISYLIFFKELILRMQYQYMKDKTFFKELYSTLKEFEFLRIWDISSSQYTTLTKKRYLMISLPTELGYRLYKYKFSQKIKDLFSGK